MKFSPKPQGTRPGAPFLQAMPWTVAEAYRSITHGVRAQPRAHTQRTLSRRGLVMLNKPHDKKSPGEEQPDSYRI